MNPQNTFLPAGSVLAYLGDNPNPIYRYAVAAFAAVATPTAMLLIQGSATKTVRVKSIEITGVATAAGNMQVGLAKWSTAGTKGSAVLTALTAVINDSKDGAASAVVSTVGTANYTTQGTGGTTYLKTGRLQLSAAGSGLAVEPFRYKAKGEESKPITLRGTSEFLAITGIGSAIPAGGVLDITIELEEA